MSVLVAVVAATPVDGVTLDATAAVDVDEQGYRPPILLLVLLLVVVVVVAVDVIAERRLVVDVLELRGVNDA